jgi:hypothetical protein
MFINDTGPEDIELYNENKRKLGKGLPTTDENCNVKIVGANVRKLNEENAMYLANYIAEEKPDFMLLNECSLGKGKFKINGNTRIGDEIKTCIIHKSDYVVHNALQEMNDDYNLIRRVDTDRGNIILYCAYMAPDELKDVRLDGLVTRLEVIKNKYNDLSLVLFADFNLKREELLKEDRV